MAIIRSEVREEVDTDGSHALMVCIAGPDGDAARASLGPSARLVAHLEGGSHFETMTRYYAMFALGTYTTREPLDMEPYPDEWARRQQGG